MGVRVFLLPDTEASTLVGPRRHRDARGSRPARIDSGPGLTGAGGEVFPHLGSGWPPGSPRSPAPPTAPCPSRWLCWQPSGRPTPRCGCAWASRPVTPPSLTSTASGPPSAVVFGHRDERLHLAPLPQRVLRTVSDPTDCSELVRVLVRLCGRPERPIPLRSPVHGLAIPAAVSGPVPDSDFDDPLWS